VDIGKAVIPGRIEACLPRSGDRGNLLVGQFGKRPDVARRMDDDLLPLEGRIKVRDDPNDPGGLVADAEGLRRRAILSPCTERALGKLGVGLLFDLARARAGTPAPVRSDGYEPPRERVSPKMQRGRGTV
jgi:hypothetical protein